MNDMGAVTINASTARQTLPEQLDRVERGEEVSITRHGRVVAVLVRPDVLAMRRASDAFTRADRIGDLLRRQRDLPLPPPALERDRAQELIDAVHGDRAAR